MGNTGKLFKIYRGMNLSLLSCVLIFQSPKTYVFDRSRSNISIIGFNVGIKIYNYTLIFLYM